MYDLIIRNGTVIDGVGLVRGSLEFVAPAFPFSYNCAERRHQGMGGVIGVAPSTVRVSACNTCARQGAKFVCGA